MFLIKIMSEILYTNLKVTELDNSEVEFEAEISSEKLEKFRKKAIEKLGKDAKIQDFDQDIYQRKFF